jgi:3-deoxy-D-manno-octulosonic-acid transferase
MRRRPVLFGPHTENFREAAALLTGSGGGLVVRDATELAAAVLRLLADPTIRAAGGAAAHEAAVSRSGAVRETLALIQRMLPGLSPS